MRIARAADLPYPGVLHASIIRRVAERGLATDDACYDTLSLGYPDHHHNPLGQQKQQLRSVSLSPPHWNNNNNNNNDNALNLNPNGNINRNGGLAADLAIETLIRLSSSPSSSSSTTNSSSSRTTPAAVVAVSHICALDPVVERRGERAASLLRFVQYNRTLSTYIVFEAIFHTFVEALDLQAALATLTYTHTTFTHISAAERAHWYDRLAYAALVRREPEVLAATRTAKEQLLIDKHDHHGKSNKEGRKKKKEEEDRYSLYTKAVDIAVDAEHGDFDAAADAARQLLALRSKGRRNRHGKKAKRDSSNTGRKKNKTLVGDDDDDRNYYVDETAGNKDMAPSSSNSVCLQPFVFAFLIKAAGRQHRVDDVMEFYSRFEQSIRHSPQLFRQSLSPLVYAAPLTLDPHSQSQSTVNSNNQKPHSPNPSPPLPPPPSSSPPVSLRTADASSTDPTHAALIALRACGKAEEAVTLVERLHDQYNVTLSPFVYGVVSETCFKTGRLDLGVRLRKLVQKRYEKDGHRRKRQKRKVKDLKNNIRLETGTGDAGTQPKADTSTSTGTSGTDEDNGKAKKKKLSASKKKNRISKTKKPSRRSRKAKEKTEGQ